MIAARKASKLNKCKLVTIENSNGTKIDYIYIFGSTLKESCTDKSDIDIDQGYDILQ